ncbi:GbsR/MarR family transcriptional regulator [Pararhizobium mangrovi]|uniref:Transcriptional regulator n=1 Tax=Pararhizobium mangrovi TaxID=2590452 RepID=A0A506UH13_9HYPH|nr:MarR family transcriptional regulator [Pararhizobium mangrovi]TPW31917.1 transcriptional regulator [Pararhizobium mangrovi]
MNEPDTTDFVESLGLIFQNEGLPRIAGRVLGFLIVSREPKSFDDLTNGLLISRGSVSTNTRLLVNLGLVERATVPGERQDYFRLGPRPYQRMVENSLERSVRARDMLRRSVDTFGEGADARFARERIIDFVAFYDVLVEAGREAGRMLREREGAG